MKIKLRNSRPFIAGHLFCNVSHEKSYEVVDKYSTMLKIVDSSGKDVWVSKTAFKKYFKEA